MKNKNITKVCVALAIGLMTSVGALAAPLNGDIGFAGSGTFNESGATDATTLSFNSVTTNVATGDYSGISAGTSATFKTLNMGAPGTVGTITTITEFWSIDSGAFTFDLERITKNEVDGASRLIEGYGTAKTTGAPTAYGGFFSLSTNLSGTSISFSAATEVPDSGTTTALLGLSMLGLAGAARRLRK